MVRSARPCVAATNTIVSPRSRAALISATQSGTRPPNSTRRLTTAMCGCRCASLAERQRLERGRRASSRCRDCRPSPTTSVSAAARRALARAPAHRRSWRAICSPVRLDGRAPRPRRARTTNTVGAAGAAAGSRRTSPIDPRRPDRRAARVSGTIAAWSSVAGRSLRRRVVGAERLDGVADELEPDRPLVAGRVEVDDAAAHAELAVTRRPDPGA